MLLEEIERLTGINDAEKMKLKIEYEKLRIERFKAWGTVLSILVPLGVGVGTLIFSVILQNKRARIDFELKAAEIVMNADSPKAATYKSQVLTELFPEYLSRQFYETFKKLYGSSD